MGTPVVFLSPNGQACHHTRTAGGRRGCSCSLSVAQDCLLFMTPFRCSQRSRGAEPLYPARGRRSEYRESTRYRGGTIATPRAPRPHSRPQSNNHTAATKPHLKALQGHRVVHATPDPLRLRPWHRALRSLLVRHQGSRAVHSVQPSTHRVRSLPCPAAADRSPSWPRVGVGSAGALPCRLNREGGVVV